MLVTAAGLEEARRGHREAMQPTAAILLLNKEIVGGEYRSIPVGLSDR